MPLSYPTNLSAYLRFSKNTSQPLASASFRSSANCLNAHSFNHCMSTALHQPPGENCVYLKEFPATSPESCMRWVINIVVLCATQSSTNRHTLTYLQNLKATQRSVWLSENFNLSLPSSSSAL